MRSWDERNSSFVAAILFLISEILQIIRMIGNTCNQLLSHWGDSAALVSLAY